MATPASHHITGLLQAWRHGDDAALAALTPLVHAELRRLARLHLRRERAGHSLQPTALVNECYLRLIDGRTVEWRDRGHFFALAARTMRRILVDAARARGTAKRGGDPVRLPLSAVADGRTARPARAGRDLIALDDALQALAAVDPRRSQVVELRFFGGFTHDEIAETLGVSAKTILRDWQEAKAWLLHALTGTAGGGEAT
jgi:RNA polymerase sigma-70 factor, ECF subfamily